MILEGLCTTINPDGSVNLAPMGPVVDEALTSFHFRPFQTSTTFANLKRTRVGVFHITDDAALVAQAAIGRLTEMPPLQPACVIPGQVLTDACRWYEFEVISIDDSRDRSEIETRIVHIGSGREFWGFNRAKHALLEIAILATRLHMVPAEEVLRQLAISEVIIEKTAGPREASAFHQLREYITQRVPLTAPWQDD